MKALLLIVTLLSSFPLLAELKVVGEYKGIPIVRSTPNQRRINSRLRACTKKYFQLAIIAVSPEKSVTETTWVLDNCPKIDINQEMFSPYRATPKSVYHWKPTHSAVFQGKVGLLELLIDRGADLDAIAKIKWNRHNASYYSPLTYALLRKEAEVALALIKGGADVNMRVSQQLFDRAHLPLERARVFGNKRVIKALLAAGAGKDDDKYNYHEDDQNRP